MSIAHTPLIDIQKIVYTYPQQKKDEVDGLASSAVLREVDLRVMQGEYVVLLGHNGSGKSTLARHCNALLLPDSGRVLIDGQDSRDVAKQRRIRESVGMIFQNPDNQIIATVVEDDIAWALTVRGLAVDIIRERVATVMEARIAASIARRVRPDDYAGHSFAGRSGLSRTCSNYGAGQDNSGWAT